MNGIPYKDTFAAKGSKLYEALTTAPLSIRDELAKRIYRETTERMHALTPKKGVCPDPAHGAPREVWDKLAAIGYRPVA